MTTANRSQFADGNPGTGTPGNVGTDSIWTVLTPATLCGIGGPAQPPWTPLTFTVQSDNSVLVTEHDSTTALYTASFKTSLVGITGIRLELMPDSSFPVAGLGLKDSTGNFVLSEAQAFVKAQ